MCIRDRCRFACRPAIRSAIEWLRMAWPSAAVVYLSLIHISMCIRDRENVQWLIEESGIPFDYDMVVIDELSSFKSYQAKRFRTLLKVKDLRKKS